MYLCYYYSIRNSGISTLGDKQRIMFTYQKIKDYQENLDLALEANDIAEVKRLIIPVAELLNVYKQKRGISAKDPNSFVLVGKLTTKNEIIFNEPKRDSVDLDNICSYFPYWVVENELGNPSDNYFFNDREVRVVDDLVQIKNPIGLNGEDSYGDIGYMIGNYKEVKVVFYDQYLEEN